MRCLAPLLLVLVIFLAAYGWLWLWPRLLDYLIIDQLPLPIIFDLAYDMSMV